MYALNSPLIVLLIFNSFVQECLVVELLTLQVSRLFVQPFLFLDILIHEHSFVHAHTFIRVFLTLFDALPHDKSLSVCQIRWVFVRVIFMWARMRCSDPRHRFIDRLSGHTHSLQHHLIPKHYTHHNNAEPQQQSSKNAARCIPTHHNRSRFASNILEYIFQIISSWLLLECRACYCL